MTSRFRYALRRPRNSDTLSLDPGWRTPILPQPSVFISIHPRDQAQVVTKRDTVSGVMANTEAKKTQECALFDWLRFLLASAVVLAHEGVFGWPQIGNLAVQVFFALSGWLIGGILLRTKPAELPR